MRQTLTIMGLLTAFGFGSPVPGQDSEKPKAGEMCVLKVLGMACGACAATVEKAAKRIDGVTAAKVSQPKGTAEISYDPAKTTPDAIAKIITQKTGFQASPPNKNESK